MKKGYFGKFGGMFVPELLCAPLRELEEAMETILPRADFQAEMNELLYQYAGRETPLTFCPTLSAETGLNIWLKREDLLHTGAHKINNTIGQALLAKHMGKTALIAETGAGQHGVATAAVAARLGLECTIYMGSEDIKRQAPNVARMKLLGAKVVGVESGQKGLKDAINVALGVWVARQDTTHYCLGSATGPHPFPTLVRNFQSVIGHEARRQFMEKKGRLPDAVVACVGGGSNAIGLFHAFVEDKAVRIIGVEGGGTGEPGCATAAPLNFGRPGILHGNLSVILQDENGQVLPSKCVSAGLDYPGIGPEHAYLQNTGRAEYQLVNDAQALGAFQKLSLKEGIIPALESSHALAYVLYNSERFAKGAEVIVNLSGRGDKDMEIVRQLLFKGDM